MDGTIRTQETSTSGKRKVNIEDLYRFRLLSDVQVSPDGKMVAHVLTRLRKKQNDYASNIWVIPCDGGAEPRKFTGSNQRDMFPRWSPTGGELGFLSTRSGKPQVWVIPVNGGEARQLTYVKHGVTEFDWSHDGKWVTFVAMEDEEKGDGGQEPQDAHQTAIDSENREPGSAGEEGFTSMLPPAGEWAEDDEEDKDAEEKGDHVSVFTRLPYKAEGQGFLQHRAHIFLVSGKGGKPRQLTHGDWDARVPRWSPDGKSLAFLANQEDDAGLRNIQDIFLLPIDDAGAPGEQRQLTGHDCSILNMAWLPSGHELALFAHSRTDEAAFGTHERVWTIDAQSGAINKLTENFDRSVGSLLNSDLRSGGGEMRPRFSRDGALIYFMVMNGGAVEIYSVPSHGGEVQMVVGGDRQVFSFDVAGDALVFAATEPDNPNDLYRVSLDGSEEKRLTDVNADVMDELSLSLPERFVLDRGDGVEVEGWLIKPVGFEEGRRYPMVTQVHGGPHTSYGNSYFHEFQVLASRGYVVMYSNPRGSQGYGQAFTDAIISDWGGVDYEDIMACVDYAISQSYVDPVRLGVAGGSYGGYMVTWIIGHDTRFKAAVASRMVSNLYSAWGSGDVTYGLWTWEMEGTPQERMALYMERSPVTYVGDMHTPLLITHAADDKRTSLEQAEQIYTALKLLKREVKMVILPSGGHEVSRTGKPSLRVERMEQIIGWLDEHLAPGQGDQGQT